MKLRILTTSLAMALATPVFAANPAAKIVWSSPQHEVTVTEPVRMVQLKFDQDVDFLSLDVEHPDNSKEQIYEATTDLVPLARGRDFAFTLSNPVSAPGQYYLNWAVSVTHPDKSTDALAGFTGFTIEAPEEPVQ